MFRAFVTVLFAGSLAASLMPPAPVHAQIGNIFSDRPRPPASVPRDEESDEEDVPDLPHGRLLPTPLQPGQAVPPPGSFQSQPLPPPGGAQQQPPSAVTTPPGAQPLPGQKQPPKSANVPPTNAPPAPATLQPGDEVVTEPPAQKIVNKQAVFAGLDKITGRIIKFDVAIGETVQFGALRVKPDACYTRPATEAANTDAFVEVDEITLQNEVKRIFSGWMFAASPGLHGVEHPVYDIWLTDCKEPQSTVATQTEPAKPAAPPQQQKRQPSQKQSAQQPPRPRAPAPPPPPPGFR